MKNIELLKKGLEGLEIEYTEKQLEQFSSYYDLLVEWNKVMNLTAITDEEEVIIKHFIDSLMVVKVMDLKKISSLIDVGTGAGFPSMPIKIMFPNIEMTLLDSLNKRIKFLNLVIANLELDQIECCHGRAEDFGKDRNYRENYEICVSRAVSNLSTLSEYCLPFVNIGGNFISYKAVEADEEIKNGENAVKILGGKINRVVKHTVVLSDFERAYVVIDKVEKTPNKYPRKPGKATKNPL